MPRASHQEFVFLRGKSKWFRPTTPNQWGKWDHTLYPDAESLEKIRRLQEEDDKALGIKNVLAKDDDGYYVRLARKTKIEPRNGVPIPLFPPEIFEKDGKTPFKEYVGNGSDITTKCLVYTHSVPGGKRARALRWESTRVDTLVPYDAPRDLNPPGQKMYMPDPKKGLAEQPTEHVMF